MAGRRAGGIWRRSSRALPGRWKQRWWGRGPGRVKGLGGGAGAGTCWPGSGRQPTPLDLTPLQYPVTAALRLQTLQLTSHGRWGGGSAVPQA